MASRNGLKRILLSILVGIAFPIAYLTFFGALDDFVLPKSELTETHLYGQASPGFLYAPMVIPIYIDQILRHYNYFGFWLALNSPWFRAPFFILFDVILYSWLAFLMFRRLRWFEAR